jgi:hypothetical protein
MQPSPAKASLLSPKNRSRRARGDRVTYREMRSGNRPTKYKREPARRRPAAQPLQPHDDRPTPRNKRRDDPLKQELNPEPGPTNAFEVPPVSLQAVSRSLELSLQSSLQLSLTVLVFYRTRGSISIVFEGVYLRLRTALSSNPTLGKKEAVPTKAPSRGPTRSTAIGRPRPSPTDLSSSTE